MSAYKNGDIIEVATGRLPRRLTARDRFRARLKRFYERHAPAKLGNVENVFAYYCTNGGDAAEAGTGVEQLDRKLREAYGVGLVQDESAAAAAAAAADAKPAAATDAPFKARRGTRRTLGDSMRLRVHESMDFEGPIADDGER